MASDGREKIIWTGGPCEGGGGGENIKSLKCSSGARIHNFFSLKLIAIAEPNFNTRNQDTMHGDRRMQPETIKPFYSGGKVHKYLLLDQEKTLCVFLTRKLPHRTVLLEST